MHSATINKVCLSGLTAIIDAARMLRLGDATVVVAAGMESMTRAPHLLMNSRDGYAYGSVEVLDHMAYDGLTDAYDRESMGASTERANARTRSPAKPRTPWPHAPTSVPPQRKPRASSTPRSCRCRSRSERAPFDRLRDRCRHADEGIRADTTVETLAKLRPAFAEGGSITAGNASQISDGASAVVVTTRAIADERGWDVLAVVGASGQVAGPDNSLHAQPARAIAKALEKQGIAASDLDLIEINEAFGAVVARSQAELGVSRRGRQPARWRHRDRSPHRRSGNRLVVHAVHELVRRGGGTAAVALCGGGGQGDALILTP